MPPLHKSLADSARLKEVDQSWSEVQTDHTDGFSILGSHGVVQEGK